MSTIAIKIMPDGTQKTIYKDDHPLLAGRSFTAKRASNVNYDEESQAWKVYNPDGSLLIEEGFAKRSDAIAAEVKMLDSIASRW